MSSFKEDEFREDDIVIFVSKRGRYWNSDKEKFVKERGEATSYTWSHAKLCVQMVAGRWELQKQPLRLYPREIRDNGSYHWDVPPK